MEALFNTTDLPPDENSCLRRLLFHLQPLWQLPSTIVVALHTLVVGKVNMPIPCIWFTSGALLVKSF